MANLEVISDFSSRLVLLLLAVLEEDGEVIVEGLKDCDIEGILRDVADLDGIYGFEDYFLGFDCHVDGEVIDLHVLFGDMEDGLRMYVFQDLSLLVDTHVDRVNEIPILDGHDLVLKVHEDDLLGVILDAELALDIVHDVVHPIRLSRLDLLSFKVDLKAPQNEALLVLFRLLEEHIDDVVNGRRYG